MLNYAIRKISRESRKNCAYTWKSQHIEKRGEKLTIANILVAINAGRNFPLKCSTQLHFPTTRMQRAAAATKQIFIFFSISLSRPTIPSNPIIKFNILMDLIFSSRIGLLPHSINVWFIRWLKLIINLWFDSPSTTTTAEHESEETAWDWMVEEGKFQKLQQPNVCDPKKPHLTQAAVRLLRNAPLTKTYFSLSLKV